MAVKTFPEDWELTSFFEVEPQLLDSNPEIPWFYNIITFQKQYADELLNCTFSPAYGDLDLALIRNQKVKLRLDLHHIEEVIVLKDPENEHLKLTFATDTLLRDFILTLKPEVSIIWGTTYE